MSTAPDQPLPPPPDVDLDGVTRRSTIKWMTLAWIGFAAATGGGPDGDGPVPLPERPLRAADALQGGGPLAATPSAWTSAGRRSSGSGSSGTPTRSTPWWPSACTSGCTPNWLQAQNKFKCPCHGSGYYVSGINFEGPAPRPLERAEIEVSGEDGQIIVDKATRYLYERGQWSDPKAFVKMA